MTLSGATRTAAVIGDPVRHSRSPAIHNAAFAELGLDWVYVALPVPAGQGAAAVEAMRVLGIDGLSVTMPHKGAVASAVDRRSDAVEKLGACNCVAREGGVLIGHNTDGAGFVASVRADAGVELAGASVAVLGAGGAARAIVHAIGEAGVDRIVVVNRTATRAEETARLASVASVGDERDLAGVDVIVNATAVGMLGGPDPDGCPMPVDLLSDRQLVADIVYQPLRTPLLEAAAARGAKTVGGLGMLVHQAAVQFELWTGEQAPVQTMIDAVRSAPAA